MHAYANIEELHECSRPPVTFHWPDPLGLDDRNDPPILVTRRRLIRLAIVAAETGARFQREGLEHDPVAWLLAPLALFDGADAINASLELAGCKRAILLHGLGIGLDADPSLLDDLLEQESEEQPLPRHV
ncbi:hypothetical protein [Sphingomonas sp. R1]|uniref:hypothetical protein n=1 Tax=Sphingomonas sp. R1 TaxID=399176 RepID=UPI0022250B0C|nr:hypothetical protein [Sphingomonas sp. R1]UYY76855.1 hypothetical protein OIM94_15290 [Sphingomonas sp. R1]